MSRREAHMWRANVRPVLQRAGLDPWRIENRVSSGTPDVNYMDGWIELKCVDRWPARGGRVPVPHFTQEQRVILSTRWRRGGAAWLLLKVVRERRFILLDGATAALALGKWATASDLERLAAASADAFLPEVFVPWLRGEEALAGGALARYYRLRCLKSIEALAADLGRPTEGVIGMEAGAAEPHVLLDYWLS